MISEGVSKNILCVTPLSKLQVHYSIIPIFQAGTTLGVNLLTLSVTTSRRGATKASIKKVTYFHVISIRVVVTIVQHRK